MPVTAYFYLLVWSVGPTTVLCDWNNPLTLPCVIKSQVVQDCTIFFPKIKLFQWLAWSCPLLCLAVLPCPCRSTNMANQCNIPGCFVSVLFASFYYYPFLRIYLIFLISLSHSFFFFPWGFSVLTVILNLRYLFFRQFFKPNWCLFVSVLWVVSAFFPFLLTLIKFMYRSWFYVALLNHRG